MMVERHYDDEALIALLETDRAGADGHLPSCTVCNEKLQSFRRISGTLRDNSVWDRRELRLDPVPSTIANLRAFADRMSAEDTAAAQILPELLAGTREEWMPRLQEHPEWRTAGVVRGLVTATISVMMTMPPDALEMTALSTEIADHLDPGTSGAGTVARLRAAAWRDRGFALYYVGRFTDSLDACETATRWLDACVVEEYDRARVGIVRALALRATEAFTAALDETQVSCQTFERFDDTTRLASARIAETHLLFSKGEFNRARRILETLELSLRNTADAHTHARVLMNLGYCLWKLGDVDAALRNHEAAAALMDDLGVHTESARIRWNVTSILVTAGRFDEAHVRLELLKAEFERLGMTSEATIVGLDMAELLLVEGKFERVEDICRAAMQAFERAGISYSDRALTALAYMREAAHLRTATPVLVKHVREYIRRLPQERELLFATLG